MTTTRVTASNNKLYDVTYTITPAVWTPEVTVPAHLEPAKIDITSVVPVTTTFANAEVVALAAISPPPPLSWLNAADALITTLKDAAIWQTLDLFYCFAAPSSNACNYNWVNTATGLLTPNGSISYSTNQYLAGDGTTGWLSSTYALNSGNARNGNAEFGYFVLNEATTENVSPFQSSASKHYLGLQSTYATGDTITNLVAGLNTSTAATFSSLYGSTVGHWVLQQNDTASQLELYLDGASIGTSTQTTSVDAGTVQLLRTGNAYTARQTSFVHYGSKLSAPQQLTLSKALYNFLTTMGVKPLAGYLGLANGPGNVAPYKHIPMGDGISSLIVPVTPQWSGYPQGRGGAFPYALCKIGDPNYQSLWRFEHHAGDYQVAWDGANSPTERLHLSATNLNFNYATTCDLAFSFYIEPGSALGSATNTAFTTLAEVHDNAGGTVSPGPFSAISTPNDPGGGGNYYVWAFNQPTNSDLIRGSKFACAQGVWHHVRTTFRMDNSPNAFIQSWFNGVQVMNYSSGPWSTSAIQPFRPMLSLYASGYAGPPGASAIWYANYEFDASGTQPYASRINTPLPVPPLT